MEKDTHTLPHWNEGRVLSPKTEQHIPTAGSGRETSSEDQTKRRRSVLIGVYAAENRPDRHVPSDPVLSIPLSFSEWQSESLCWTDVQINTKDRCEDLREPEDPKDLQVYQGHMMQTSRPARRGNGTLEARTQHKSWLQRERQGANRSRWTNGANQSRWSNGAKRSCWTNGANQSRWTNGANRSRWTNGAKPITLDQWRQQIM
ncbi:hypothetical protein EYF80_039038 [Liparis tanakae]|uniref:Uncharacterized protein n=1 Tax=Liparis tanakae TaxID=230148 RepID=A0A4Z2GCY8_9TELE|nr:hypothetical protein EYF80_039038 [Liparis tanakae]